MSAPAPHLVVVDDADPSVVYSGDSWSNDTSPGTGNFGPVYAQSLHKTFANGTVYFNFNGSSISVHGTNNPVEVLNNPDPKFECFLDDVSIGRTAPFNFTESNWLLCNKDDISDGPHSLRIDVTVQSPNHPFYLDYFYYVPSASVPLDDKVIMIQDSDPSVSYDSQWIAYHGTQAHLTSTSGATAQVNFVGTSLTWFGIISGDSAHNSTTISYNVDGEKEYQVLLRGLPSASSATAYNQIFFTTPEMDAGSHTLTVTYHGSNETTPLVLDYFLVKNGTNTVSPTGGSTTQGSSASTSPSSSHSMPVGAIVGGVVGGVAVVILAGIVFLTWRRQRSSWSARRNERAPSPFYATPTTHTQGATSFQPSRLKQESAWATQPSPGQSPAFMNLSSKQQRVMNSGNTTGSHRSLPSTPGSAPTDGYSLAPTTSTNVVTRQHLDSGIRLNRPIVQDIPPNYTYE